MVRMQAWHEKQSLPFSSDLSLPCSQLSFLSRSARQKREKQVLPFSSGWLSRSAQLSPVQLSFLPFSSLFSPALPDPLLWGCFAPHRMSLVSSPPWERSSPALGSRRTRSRRRRRIRRRVPHIGVTESDGLGFC